MTTKEAMDKLKSDLFWKNALKYTKDTGHEPEGNEKYLAYKMAIEALQKQEAQAPILQGDGYADGKMVYDIWHCPNCDTAYETETQYNYCPWCGQKLNWEEQEESEE